VSQLYVKQMQHNTWFAMIFNVVIVANERGVLDSVGSTSVLHWLHAIAQCNNSFLFFYVRFYNSELHISFVRARGCRLRH
jgi:hypothetical protein